MKNIFEVGGFYSRYTIGDVLNDTRIKTSREGVVVSGDAVLLFVTLDKEAQSNTNLRYNDFFEQDLFHWDSQNRQTINSPTIKKIVDKTVEVFYLHDSKRKLNQKLMNSFTAGSFNTRHIYQALLSRYILFLRLMIFRMNQIYI